MSTKSKAKCTGSKDCYQIIDFIAQGSFGAAMLVENKSSHVRSVMKVISLGNGTAEVQKAQKEVQLL